MKLPGFGKRHPAWERIIVTFHERVDRLDASPETKHEFMSWIVGGVVATRYSVDIVGELRERWNNDTLNSLKIIKINTQAMLIRWARQVWCRYATDDVIRRDISYSAADIRALFGEGNERISEFTCLYEQFKFEAENQRTFAVSSELTLALIYAELGRPSVPSVSDLRAPFSDHGSLGAVGWRSTCGPEELAFFALALNEGMRAMHEWYESGPKSAQATLQ